VTYLKLKQAEDEGSRQGDSSVATLSCERLAAIFGLMGLKAEARRVTSNAGLPVGRNGGLRPSFPEDSLLTHGLFRIQIAIDRRVIPMFDVRRELHGLFAG